MGGDLSTAGAGVLRSGLPAGGWRSWFAVPRFISAAGGVEPGCRFSGAGHPDGGGHDDAAGNRRTFLDQLVKWADGDFDAAGDVVWPDWPDRFLPPWRCLRAGHRAHRQRVLWPVPVVRTHGHRASAVSQTSPGSLKRYVMKRLMVLSSIAALALSAFATLAQAKPLEAVASFTVIADMVSTVGGDRVHVKSLIGPNGDPHVYEPTPSDAQALKNADLAFVSGLHLEGWMDRLIKASGYKGKPVVLSEGVKTRSMDEDGKRIVDPHAWNSAANGVIYVRNIIAALKKADPEGASVYQANGDRYIVELQQLDIYARDQIHSIPNAKRKILTSHDAFGYFGDAYGVTFLSPLGLSTESEASAADVSKLIRQIKAEHVSAYFFENSSDPRLVKQIAEASGAQPGGELYVESLSPADGPAPTYAKMFRYNVDTLTTAMKCNQ
ncbi:Cation ABC transporter periplasmic cation-binding protein [Pseudomonas syringae pv. helianthi]|uniref:Cation ABC transporter periplasmic cation-binding protein n=2 Tax=Pseudomonas TaxID=286 RepID=A0A3M6CGN6_9PSED|nr:Cation ABC transporter periplasmic cation-binding protein [Pseudomonas syringae pv. helianthi]